MLNRSQRGREVADLLSQKLLQRNTALNRLVTFFLPSAYRTEQNELQNIDIGYLPYKARQRYELLAEDWCRVLKLTSSEEVVLDALVRITGLHLSLYLLEEGSERSDAYEMPRIVLNVGGHSNNHMHELSRVSYDANRNHPLRALRQYLTGVKETSEWAAAQSSLNGAELAKEILGRRFAWDMKEIGPRITSAEKMFEQFLTQAENRHSQHFSKVLPVWWKAIGLSAARTRAGTWYTPSDHLLKTLVLSTVPRRLEFSEFLQALYRRYRLVIGPTEAEESYGKLPRDHQSFSENAQRLEVRLRSLGLLQRLSDDCAYVKNPFAEASHA